MRNRIATKRSNIISGTKNKLPEILFITSYPPRECGITTYYQDLIKALDNKFKHSFKIKIVFSWFLGNNHLHQIIYNPYTGGCYDGLEDLNQGAESTVSYLMARLAVEKSFKKIAKRTIPN